MDHGAHPNATHRPAGIDAGLRTSPLAGRLPVIGSAPGPDCNAVLDCTRTDRFGLRGPGALAWLESAGIAVPGSVNSAHRLDTGLSVLRLGRQEVLLTAAPGHCTGLADLKARWRASDLREKGFDGFREEGWAWVTISGPAADRVMARISMTDLRPRTLTAGSVAQTRALHQDVVIARLDWFGSLSYDLFFDIASAEFTLDVLRHAVDGLGLPFQFAELLTPAGSGAEPGPAEQ